MGACGIGSVNPWLAMQKSVELIEIDGSRNVGGDHGIILAEFGNAIDLDSEKDGNAVVSKLPRELHRF